MAGLKNIGDASRVSASEGGPRGPSEAGQVPGERRGPRRPAIRETALFRAVLQISSAHQFWVAPEPEPPAYMCIGRPQHDSMT
jgi:hypothetical protein